MCKTCFKDERREVTWSPWVYEVWKGDYYYCNNCNDWFVHWTILESTYLWEIIK